MGYKENLARGLRNFSPYFGLKTASDLITANQLQNVTGERGVENRSVLAPSAISGRVIELLIDTSTGALTTPELIRAINNVTQTTRTDSGTTASDEINQRVKIVYSNDLSLRLSNSPNVVSGLEGFLSNQGMNRSPANPTKQQPSMSAIQLFDSRISPCIKNSNALIMFMNFVPLVELVRCTPFLDIQFITPRNPLDANKRLQTTSLNKFLLGAKQILSESSVEYDTTFANTITNSDGSISSVTGMELFTTPQTLQNLGDTNVFDASLRANPIRDKMRPFMTIESLVIDIAPSGGMSCYKTAKLAVILHDSSRLSEIAEMVKPDMYGQSEILLDYGWQHPDDSTRNNPYGDLMNGMRCKEKYAIVNSTFAFDEVGQVKLTLQLAMRCATDLNNLSIASSESARSAQETVERISRVVGELRTHMRSNPYPGTAEIRGSQIIDAAEDVRNQSQFTPALRTALNELAQTASRRSSRGRQGHQTQSRTDLQQILSQVRNLYEGSNSAISTLRTSIATEIARKMQQMARSYDPFLEPLTTEARVISDYQERPRRAARVRGANIRTDSFNSTDIGSSASRVSLGKLLLEFVGVPLLSTGKYDDIQWIFHKFNSHASDASKKNIAGFDVDIAWFQEQFIGLRMQNIGRTANMPVSEFISFVTHNIIEDFAAIDYGLSAVYRHERDEEGRPVVRPVRVNNSSDTRIGGAEIANNLDAIMRTKVADGVFKMPLVDMYFESLAGASIADPDSRDPNGKTILRIHVFDRQASPYETYGSLLAASRDETMLSIGRLVNQAPPSLVEQNNLALQSAILGAAQSEAGLIVEDPPGSHIYRINKSHRELKEFVMQTVPYIVYGTNGTAIKTASVQTLQDAALTTVNMLRSARTGAPLASGEDVGGLPLRVTPTEMSISSFGCPLIDFGQQFFCDFNTGTTIDNLYGVVGYSHSFAQGKFDTEIKLSPLDAYGSYQSLQAVVENAARVIGSQTENNGTT